MIKRIISLLLSFACLTAAAFLTWQENNHYESIRNLLPTGSTIAGIPVGGITLQEAGLRLARAYLSTPVEARYRGSTIMIDPQSAGFKIDLDSMLAQAEQANQTSFLDYLQNHIPPEVHVALKASIDHSKLQTTLAQIGAHYGKNPLAAQPIPGGQSFTPAQSGEQMDVNQGVTILEPAFFSLDQRVVDLSAQPLAAPTPAFDQLNPMLSALIQTSGFEGTIELYLQDMTTGKEINLAYQKGQPVLPGIAFTGASTIKIPVMISAYRHIDQISPELQKRMELMIDVSDNGSTDEVMKSTMDQNLAPIEVTEDMRALGLKDTFLAGFFYTGAPLLQRFETPANQRQDLSTDPDPYNQTTPAEMGTLIADIERCAEKGSGPLITTFTGQITQNECQSMLSMLKKNRKAVLIEAGLPEGTVMGHKYGWVTDPADGLMHTLSDAAIVYTPTGNYILSIYVYDSEQLLWDSAQALVAHLTIAVEQYYNLFSTSE